MKRQESWMNKIFKEIQHQSYDYIFKDGFFSKRPKRGDKFSLQVLGDSITKKKILKKFYDTLWPRYGGIWATYTKIKEKYL